ncbi:MAG: hypothetical protein ABF649_15935 [Bacillus sp. (in: firmicutes)]
MIKAKEMHRKALQANKPIIPATPYQAVNMQNNVHTLNCQTIHLLIASNNGRMV